jgi:hypothetical protein
MNTENFENVMGHDNFVWWIGVIEDRFDDQLTGGMRYRVRIFNAHTPDLNKVPTKDLPWAIPLCSPNGSFSTSAAREGDWAFGFYTDGMSKQAPVVIGIFPRIVQPQNTSNGGAFTDQAKLYNSNITEDQVKNTTPVSPSFAPATNPRRIGFSTIPALSYTYTGTMVEYSDNTRAHVCDITNEIRLSAAIEFIKNLQIFTTIRTALESASTAAAASPIATQILSAIKCLREYLKTIREIIKIVNVVINEIIGVLRIIRAMIAWILSLPARLKALLQACLAELYGAIASAIGSAAGGVSQTQIAQQAIGLYQDTITTIGDAVNVIAASETAINETTSLVDPKSYGRP